MPNIKFLLICIVAITFVMHGRSAAANELESRLALVIGNSSYQDSPLRNPKNDAADMAKTLESLGFEVILQIDTNHQKMTESIRTFGDRLNEEKGVGLFYYAGHGVQVDGTNYLIPVNSPIKREDEVEFNSINVGSVLAKMQSANNDLNIIVLDACRNNPFEGTSRTALSRGLARIKPPGGSVVMYSAGEGEVASDGEGRNGTFTHHLLKGLSKPGMSLRQLIYETRVAVHKETDGEQLPWIESSLLQDFVFSTSPISKPVKTIAPRKPEVQPLFVKPAEANNGLGELFVNTEPSDARVRIMNIVERYRPGIELNTRKQYDVLVTKPGFTPWREQVVISGPHTEIQVTLNPINNTPTVPGFRAMGSASYTMGCSTGDRQCATNEKTQSPIKVQPFHISASEVSVAEFRQFIDETGYVTDAEKDAGGFNGCYIWTEKGGISRSYASWGWSKTSSWKNPGFKQGDDHPVTCVSWNDAVAYTEWLSGKLGHHARLPTEAEWEFAARAGTTGPFANSSKESALCSFANGADKSASPGGSRWTNKMKCRDGYWFTAPVMSFKPNAYGLHDMLGNVREWTSDVWSEKHTARTSSLESNTTGDASNGVLRGGGWEGAAKQLRVSARNKGIRNSRAAMTGFRVVLDLNKQAAK